jgi:PadR family transcriptional regulator PadR
MVEISSDVIRGYNDTMILYILLKEPSYGYEISKQIKEIDWLVVANNRFA